MEQVRPMSKEERIARVCHEVNRAYCAAIGDHSHMAWEAAPALLRDSVIIGVKAHLDAGPEGLAPGESHAAWLKYKQEEGWKWGPVKDLDRKEHPCCVPFGLLPQDQQVKDYLFGAVVRELRGLL